MNYCDYQKPEWVRRREQIKARDKYKCQKCGTCARRSLRVHHLDYLKDGAVWDSPDEDLVTLCEPCHETVELCVKAVRRFGHIGFFAPVIHAIVENDRIFHPDQHGGAWAMQVITEAIEQRERQNVLSELKEAENHPF